MLVGVVNKCICHKGTLNERNRNKICREVVREVVREVRFQHPFNGDQG